VGIGYIYIIFIYIYIYISNRIIGIIPQFVLGFMQIDTDMDQYEITSD